MTVTGCLQIIQEPRCHSEIPYTLDTPWVSPSLGS